MLYRESFCLVEQSPRPVHSWMSVYVLVNRPLADDTETLGQVAQATCIVHCILKDGILRVSLHEGILFSCSSFLYGLSLLPLGVKYHIFWPSSVWYHINQTKSKTLPLWTCSIFQVDHYLCFMRQISVFKSNQNCGRARGCLSYQQLHRCC